MNFLRLLMQMQHLGPNPLLQQWKDVLTNLGSKLLLRSTLGVSVLPQASSNLGRCGTNYRAAASHGTRILKLYVVFEDIGFI
jgi:hypothetical protein